jgi:two-component system chemotaxis response regulator CheB
MPATFTQTFAQRLDQICPLSVKEAEEGDELKPGHVYIAPGGKQMLLKRSVTKVNIQIADSEPGQNYHPCVDVTFKSIAGVYGGDVLAVVMTGMGADGCEGASLLSKSGAAVWAQDEQSCVVYGMPMAVVNAGIADRVLRLDEIGVRLAKDVKAWTS